ncbi:MAG: sigma-70 family RNA polymerase sigma factor [Saprospiraceae bacterium]|nr:sigma-70 family RNA polymerase sigma factor [Saprospiraceae bacterium]
MTEQDLIAGCKKENRVAQKALYDRYSALMFSICLRYVKNYTDAEDVMIEGFYKIMSKIDQYSGQGSFEGWMRRVMVNEALMFLRKNHNFRLTVEIDQTDRPTVATIEDELAARDILALLDRLPTGYRTVFNLYVLEGLKHREIAEELGISINTSKSQLILAKKRLQEMILFKESPGVKRME